MRAQNKHINNNYNQIANYYFKIPRMLNFKEISKENLFPIIKLKVKEEQEDQVAKNIISIVQGNYEEKSWFRGIYFEDTPVGFVMLELDTENSKYSVWRFMIDKEHQGKGYGKQAIEMIKEVIKEKFPDAKEIYLSYVPKEKNGADGFYKKIGFQDTGKLDNGEKVMCFTY